MWLVVQCLKNCCIVTKLTSCVCTDTTFGTVLELYMENPEMPLPSPEEVFICNKSTTAEEVVNFIAAIYRAKALLLYTELG